MAGESYVIIAASLRMSTSFSILTRHSSKFCQMCAPHASVSGCAHTVLADQAGTHDVEVACCEAIASLWPSQAVLSCPHCLCKRHTAVGIAHTDGPWSVVCTDPQGSSLARRACRRTRGRSTRHCRRASTTPRAREALTSLVPGLHATDTLRRSNWCAVITTFHAGFCQSSNGIAHTRCVCTILWFWSRFYFASMIMFRSDEPAPQGGSLLGLSLLSKPCR